jgi:hypothetical protein
VSSAVGAGCTRCTAAEIESYLATIEDDLDVDGDGNPAALTDGLLILRFLFGLTGSTLTNGAVNLDGCTRCGAATIEPYVQGLT